MSSNLDLLGDLPVDALLLLTVAEAISTGNLTVGVLLEQAPGLHGSALHKQDGKLCAVWAA